MHYYFNRIAPPLAILGGVNWALLGAANVDLVAKVFGSGTTLTHSVYVLTGLATLYCLGRASTFRSEPVPTV